MQFFKFVWQRAIREIMLAKQRSFLVIMCIAVGISSIAAIQFYSSSIENYFQKNIKEIAGGDIVISARTDLTDDQVAFLEAGVKNSKFEWTYVQQEQSVIFNEEDYLKSAIVNITKVDLKKYPLYGEKLDINVGEVLIDPTTMENMGLEVGDYVRHGNERLVVGGVHETSSGLFANSLFGTMVLPYDALPQTISQGTILVKVFDQEQLDSLANQFRSFFPSEAPGEERGQGRSFSVRTYLETSEQISEMANQVGNFLLIAGLTSLVLGGLGVYSSVSMMIKQKMNDIAVMKCYGGKGWQIILIFVVQVMVLTAIGIALGIAAGICLFRFVPNVIKELIDIAPEFYLDWAVIGRVTILGLLIAGLFSFLPVIDTLKIKPLLVYRLENIDAMSRRKSFGTLTLAVVALPLIFGSVISLMVDSWTVGLGFTIGLLVLIALLYIPARLLIAFICRIPIRRSVALRLGLGNIRHQANRTASAVISIGIGLGAILLITLFQNNVIGILENTLNDAATYNIIVAGLSPVELKEMERTLNEREDVDKVLPIPMVSGSVLAINGTPLNELGISLRGTQMLMRMSIPGLEPNDDFLITPVIDGQWLSSEGNFGDIVIHADFAELTSLKVGDVLTFITGGQEQDLTVIGIMQEEERGVVFGLSSSVAMRRSDVEVMGIDDNSMGTVLIRTALGYPSSAVTADLRAYFPQMANMILDIGQIFELVYKIFTTSTKFVKFLGLFSVFAGGIILSGIIVLTKYQRRKDIAIIRCLGGETKTVLGANWFEYAMIGLISGVLGIVSANLIVKVIMNLLLQEQFQVELVLNGLFLLAAIAFTSIVGMISIADVLGEKPLSVLKYD